MHACTCVCIHNYMASCAIHTYIELQSSLHAHIHMCWHPHTSRLPHTCIHAFIHTCSPVCIDTHTDIHTDIHPVAICLKPLAGLKLPVAISLRPLLPLMAVEAWVEDMYMHIVLEEPPDQQDLQKSFKDFASQVVHLDPAISGDPETLKMILMFEAARLLKEWKSYKDLQGFFSDTDQAGTAEQFLQRMKAAIEKTMESLKEPEPEPADVLRRPSGTGAASSSQASGGPEAKKRPRRAA